MGTLPYGEDIDYSPVKIKITKSDVPYGRHIGETIDAKKRTWYKDGKIDHIDFQANLPSGGYDVVIPAAACEVVRAQSL